MTEPVLVPGLDPTTYRGRRVGVVLGGVSAERDISLKTGDAFVSALAELGYDVGRYDLPDDLSRLAEEDPAAVLIALHGGFGENGTLQGWLEMNDIPYTGSGVLASALALDKARAKAVFRSRGVPVAPDHYMAASNYDASKLRNVVSDFGLPVVVKLNSSGSSHGVFICRDAADVERAAVEIETDLEPDDPANGVLVEAFVDGPEYSVGFFDGTFLGAIEIRPADGFYDFHAKYEANTTEYVPVEPSALRDRLEELGRRAYAAIGCRGVARVDLIGSDDELVALEVNTIPGMTATSLVPKMAARQGVPFGDFVELMLSAATCEGS